jgi:hypothetical protein
MGFEPTISAGERTQTYATDRAATGTFIIRVFVFGATDPSGPGPPHSRGF